MPDGRAPSFGTAAATRRNDARVHRPDRISVNRERVERMWKQRKERRAIATRYERTVRSLLSALHLAAASDWLKPERVPVRQNVPESATRRLAFVLVVPLLLAASSAAVAQAPSAPVGTLRELRSALTACWRPPAGSAGSEITLRFSLTHKGELRGLPMITYSKLTGSREVQERFVAAALAALLNCTPVRLTDGLGRIASQRMLHIRLISRPRTLSI